MAIQIQSIVQRKPHPSAFWAHLIDGIPADLTSGTAYVDFDLQVDSAGNPTDIPTTGALAPRYTGPPSFAEMDPTTELAWAQELAEQETPLAPVGYTRDRRALDYLMMVAIEFGYWWKELVTMAALAKDSTGRTERLQETLAVTDGKGNYEAFLLAIGDLNSMPFSFPMIRTPQIDEIMEAVAGAVIDTGVLDHIGFNLGWGRSKVGISSHPSTGQRVYFLDTQSVTYNMMHPWRKAIRNPGVHDLYGPRFNSRLAGIPDPGEGETSPTIMAEGGAATVWPDCTWERNITELGVLTKDNANDHFPIFDGEYVAMKIGTLATPETEPLRVRPMEWDDPVTSQSFGARNNNKGGEVEIDTCSASHPSAYPTMHTLGNATAQDWITVLTALKKLMPSTAYHLLDVTGRVKKSLPGGEGTVALPGGAQFGYLQSMSRRDGYISPAVPNYNITSKLEYNAQNGPFMLDVDTQKTPATSSGPVPLAGQNRWTTEDQSSSIVVKDLDGLSKSLDQVPGIIVGEWQSYTINEWLPPRFSENDMHGSDLSERVYLDLLTLPTNRTPTGTTTLGNRTSVSSAVGMKEVGTTLYHTHPVNGYTRGMIRAGPEGDAETYFWGWNPNVLALAGKGWKAWAGEYLPACSWVDPYRLKPFSSSTVWAERKEIMDSPIAGFVTAGYQNSHTPGYGQTQDIQFAELNPFNAFINYDDTTTMFAVPHGRPLSWVARMGYTALESLALALQSPTFLTGTGPNAAVYSTVHNYPVVNLADGQAGNAAVKSANGLALFGTHMNINRIGGPTELFGTENGAPATARPEGVSLTSWLHSELHIDALTKTVGIPPLDFGPRSLYYVGTGDYLIADSEDFIPPSVYNAFAWLASLYTGRTALLNTWDPIDELSIERAANPNKNTLLGASLSDAVNNDRGGADPIGVVPAAAGGASLLDWDTDGVPVSAAKIRQRQLQLTNPWVKDSDDGFGFRRVNYEPLRGVDSLLRKRARQSYRDMFPGLNNDLFRDLQIVN